MPNILVLYGTTDGHTRKIANVLAHELRALECHVNIVDAADQHRRRGPEGYDGVVVAASVHAGGYQRSVARWVRAHAAALATIPTAFLSVCLAVVERRPEAHRAAEEIMARFFRQTGWHPTVAKLVAGALLYTRYGWIKRMMMRRIVAKAGGETDTSRDYEYTDWDDLRSFAETFAARVAAKPVSVESRACARPTSR